MEDIMKTVDPDRFSPNILAKLKDAINKLRGESSFESIRHRICYKFGYIDTAPGHAVVEGNNSSVSEIKDIDINRFDFDKAASYIVNDLPTIINNKELKTGSIVNGIVILFDRATASPNRLIIKLQVNNEYFEEIDITKN